MEWVKSRCFGNRFGNNQLSYLKRSLVTIDSGSSMCMALRCFPPVLSCCFIIRRQGSRAACLQVEEQQELELLGGRRPC